MGKDITENQLHIAIFKQMVTLATSGFGLVAALAWNNVIQDLVANHIKPYLPEGSSLLSLFVYAVIITVLAVLITYSLMRLEKQFEGSKTEKAPPLKKPRKKTKLRK